MPLQDLALRVTREHFRSIHSVQNVIDGLDHHANVLDSVDERAYQGDRIWLDDDRAYKALFTSSALLQFAIAVQIIPLTMNVIDFQNIFVYYNSLCALGVQWGKGYGMPRPPAGPKRAAYALRAVAETFWRAEVKRAQSREMAIPSDPWGEADARKVFLSPGQCLDRLPLKGLTDRQKYNMLDSIRDRCARWLDTELRQGRGGKPQRWILEDHWKLIVRMMKRYALDQRNVASGIEALPITPAEVEARKQEIREERFRAMEARK